MKSTRPSLPVSKLARIREISTRRGIDYIRRGIGYIVGAGVNGSNGTGPVGDYGGHGGGDGGGSGDGGYMLSQGTFSFSSLKFLLQYHTKYIGRLEYLKQLVKSR